MRIRFMSYLMASIILTGCTGKTTNENPNQHIYDSRIWEEERTNNVLEQQDANIQDKATLPETTPLSPNSESTQNNTNSSSLKNNINQGNQESDSNSSEDGSSANKENILSKGSVDKPFEPNILPDENEENKEHTLE